jgi:hypothetical protein
MIDMEEWEMVAENTWRLELNTGHLYRFGPQIVFVPDDINQSLYNLSEALVDLTQLFKETTFEVNGKEGVRAIRNCDIGD